MAFPENLLRAHVAAEALRPESIKAIEASPKLLQHADMIERTGNLFQYFGHYGPFRDDDDVVIRVLGHRSFNDLMVAASFAVNILVPKAYHPCEVRRSAEIHLPLKPMQSESYWKALV